MRGKTPPKAADVYASAAAEAPYNTPPLASSYNHLYNTFRTDTTGQIPRLTTEEYAAWKETHYWDDNDGQDVGHWTEIRKPVTTLTFSTTPKFLHSCGYSSTNKYTVETVNTCGNCPACMGKADAQDFVNNMYTDTPEDGICDCGMCGHGCYEDKAPGSRLCESCTHHGVYRGVDTSLDAPVYDPDVCVAGTDPDAAPEFCPCAECRDLTECMSGDY
jgi:hypothetical protein